MTLTAIVRGSLTEVVEVFEKCPCKYAVFPVNTFTQASACLREFVGWEIKSTTMTAEKQGKTISFVYSKEHVYGRGYDFLGITADIEDFSYYVSRLR